MGTIKRADVQKLGAMLFTRSVSGTRYVNQCTKKTVLIANRVIDPAAPGMNIAGFSFPHYGAHCNNYGTPYLTVAAAIGLQRQEVDSFFKILSRTFRKFIGQQDSSADSDPENVLVEA